MILLLEVVAVLAVVFGVAVVLTGRGAGLSAEGRDYADVGIPRDRAMTSADVIGLRFALALRGYRMAEVDDALDRLAAELAARDEAIARLRTELATRDGAVPAPLPEPEPETVVQAVVAPEPVPAPWLPPVLAEASPPPPPPAPEPPPAPAPPPVPPPEPDVLTAPLADVDNPFRPSVPEIPTYDPWSVTPRSRYTDGPKHLEVEHEDDHDVEAITEHHSGYAPAPEPADAPADNDEDAEDDEPPAPPPPPTWPS